MSESKPRMSPNQLVAYNLRRARRRRGWRQEEAARRLAPYLGERWSVASYSAAERSYETDRVRRFSADELYAFARVFELPLAFFLAPTPIEAEIAPGRASETTDREQALALCYDLPESAHDALIGPEGVLELSAPETRALIRWRDNYTAAVRKRQAEIKKRGWTLAEDE